MIGAGVGPHRSGMRRSGRSNDIRVAIAMFDRDGMDEAVFETPLNRDGLGLGHESAVVAPWSGFDERPAAIVLKDEFIAKNFGHLSLHGNGSPVLHGADRTGGEGHEGDRGMRPLGQCGRARPDREGADDRGRDGGAPR